MTFKHGTRNGYQRHGCRCDECVAEQNRYSREYRRERRVKDEAFRAVEIARNKAAQQRLREALMADPDHPSHGRNGSYSVGCRCLKCKVARSEYRRKRRERMLEQYPTPRPKRSTSPSGPRDGKKRRRKTVRMSVSEEAKVALWAEAHGLTFSEYLRMRALEDPIEKEAA